MGSWRTKHRLLFPSGVKSTVGNSYTDEIPSFVYSESGKSLAVFNNYGADQRTEIWKEPFINSPLICTFKQKSKPLYEDTILRDNGTFINHNYYFGTTQPHKKSLGVSEVTIQSPIDSSCVGSLTRGSSSRLRVGLHAAKLWHAYLFDSWTGKILKDLRDPSKRAQVVSACGISGDGKTIAIAYANYIGIWRGSGSDWKLSKKLELPSIPGDWYSGFFLSEHGEFILRNLADNRIYWQRLK